MKIEPSRNFEKSFKVRVRHNPKLVARTKERIELFRRNPNNPVLKDHPLKGKKRVYRSFSITGDIRIIYYYDSKNHVILIDIGSHSQVY